MDKRLLDILCCPVSKSPLRPIDRTQLKALNECIRRGEIQRVDGSKVAEEVRDALISEDGKVIYRVEDGIPVLLPEEGIGTTQFT